MNNQKESYWQSCLNKQTDKLPSCEDKDYWKFASAPDVNFRSSDVSGKWCILLPEDKVDNAWLVIKKAAESGLFLAARVSTKLNVPFRVEAPNYIINVLNEDSRDLVEVERVRKELFALGFHDIFYKTDMDTVLGNNALSGVKEFSFKVCCA